MSPLESGTLFDEFLLNNNGVLLQLSDDDGNAIELPSQGAKEFPRFLDVLFQLIKGLDLMTF